MTIPLPMLWQTTLPRVQKAALAVCFSGGLFVTMAGILRCIYIITVSCCPLPLLHARSRNYPLTLGPPPPKKIGPRQRRPARRLLGRP